MAAVGFGVAALILTGAFIEWIFWATREGTIQAGLGHIHVARQGFQEHGAADLGRYLLPADSPVLQALRDTPGVKTVAPRRSLSGLVRLISPPATSTTPVSASARHSSQTRKALPLVRSPIAWARSGPPPPASPPAATPAYAGCSQR